MSLESPPTSPSRPAAWLGRGVLAVGLASLFSDFSHEIATALLPGFLVTVLAAPPFALGLIEGVADGASSLFKIVGGIVADRPHTSRRQLASAGYLVTALATGALALVTVWPQALLARVGAWMAKGLRSPSKKALLVENVTPETYGRGFGFERAMDSLGAVLGPLTASALLVVFGRTMDRAATYRLVFASALVPGVVAALCIAVLAVERRRDRAPDRAPQGRTEVPLRFRRFLVAAGLFGMGNFAQTLLVLRATTILVPKMGAIAGAAAAVGLYTWSNAVNSGAAFPAGFLADRLAKPVVLGLGYGLFAILCLGFMLPWATSLPALALLFTLAGLSAGIVDTVEDALAAELLAADRRGRGFGSLAAVNSVGDMVSSIAVGVLWTVAPPAWGFAYAAALSLGGCALLPTLRAREP